ncbi:hypothetical protein WJ85_15175 [Burkholderia ubonensis]|uniref:hypothetical protein n=1 Tax=Burkholderia ubonensis TaxID=101571 RepID=UPI00075D0B1A|nr:hypothetical protein [Burkholderia ubonensis]KVP13596.1 hypothetical protein WJ85_15175 [Burkholderia ubonensis]KWC00052.1 hypothetical protein WL44_01235 [Burkholderia ubonensis]
MKTDDKRSTNGAGGRAAQAVRIDPPPPQVPRADENGGIGWDDVKNPRKTVAVLVGPYAPTEVGDQLNLYWADPNRAVDHIDVEVAGARIFTMHVTPADILRGEEGRVEVFYTVTSGLTGDTTSSPPKPVEVKLSIPGGADRDPGTPYINENLEEPQVPFKQIGAPEANAGFDVTILPWENMEFDDALALYWGKAPPVPGPSPVVPEQSVLVHIDKDTIDAGGDGDGLVVRYDVIDRVGNWSLWSMEAKADVDVGGNKLLAPLVIEAPAGELDLDTLAGRDVTVAVLKQDNDGLPPRATVTMTWDGRPPIGDPVVDTQVKVVPDPVPPFVPFTVRNATVAEIAQGLAVVSYVVVPEGGGPSRPSRDYTVTVNAKPITPVITSVRDSRGRNIDEGGTTFDRSVTLIGKADRNILVDIFDNDELSGSPKSDPKGDWIHSTGTLVTRVHEFTAISTAGERPPSNSFKFAVGSLDSPWVLGATGPNYDFLSLNAYYNADFITVQIQPYSELMKPDDTVRVIWSGRFEYKTEVRPVGSQGRIEFQIPRLEVLDCIGLNVGVSYTVALRGRDPVYLSEVRQLKVEDQSLNLPAPTFDRSTSTVTVSYDGATDQTVAVRWDGTTERDTEIQLVVPGQSNVFRIDPGWISENNGRMVRVAYSIGRRDADVRLQFSRVLRLYF